MGFTFGAKSQSLGASNPITFSHTTVADTHLLVLGIITRQSFARTGGTPTYNGVAMTQVGSVVLGDSECTAEMWYLSNPPIGAYDFSVPNVGLQIIRLIASSYVNAAASGAVLDQYGTFNLTEANPIIQITTTADGEACVDIYGSGNTTPATDQTQTLLYKTDEGVWSTHSQYAEQASAGLIYFGWTIAAVEDVAMIAAGFKAIAGGQAIQVTDSGAGNETVTRPKRETKTTDAATGTDTFTRPQRTMTLTELVQGGESVLKLRNVAALIDSATGLESIFKARVLAVLDSATGVETVRKERQLLVIDSAVGAETVIKEIIGEILKLVTDAATGSEIVARLKRDMVLQEFANGIETILKTRNVKASDVASGLEAIFKSRIVAAITDGAVGSEAILKSRALFVSDASAGMDQIFRPERYITITDLVSGIEQLLKTRNVAAIIDLATGAEVITAIKPGGVTGTKIYLLIGNIAIELSG